MNNNLYRFQSAIAFYNKFAASLPPQVSSAISLLPVNVVDFKGTTSDDLDMMNSSINTLFKNAGITLLDRNKAEGSVAFTNGMISDSLTGLRPLEQIAAFVNRYIKAHIGGNITTRIDYMRVSPYMRGDELTKALSACEFSIPAKIRAATLLGLDAYDSYSEWYLEENVLKLSENWKPLQSAHTQSGGSADPNDPTKQGGRPANDGNISTGDTETTVNTSTSISKTSTTTSE